MEINEEEREKRVRNIKAAFYTNELAGHEYTDEDKAFFKQLMEKRHWTNLKINY